MNDDINLVCSINRGSSYSDSSMYCCRKLQ